MSEMTSRRVHWFDVDVVGTMSIPSPGLDNVTAQAAVADDDDDDDDFALHPSVVLKSIVKLVIDKGRGFTSLEPKKTKKSFGEALVSKSPATTHHCYQKQNAASSHNATDNALRFSGRVSDFYFVWRHRKSANKTACVRSSVLLLSVAEAKVA